MRNNLFPEPRPGYCQGYVAEPQLLSFGMATPAINCMHKVQAGKRLCSECEQQQKSGRDNQHQHLTPDQLILRMAAILWLIDAIGIAYVFLVKGH